MLVSDVQKSYIGKYIQILFHYRLLQDTEYSVLCYPLILVVYFLYSSLYLLIPGSLFKLSFGSAGSSLLCVGFLQLRQTGTAL